MRSISVYNTVKSTLLSEIRTTVSPATLVPHFDADTKLLFLTGKVECILNIDLSTLSPFDLREIATFLLMSMWRLSHRTCLKSLLSIVVLIK